MIAEMIDDLLCVGTGAGRKDGDAETVCRRFLIVLMRFFAKSDSSPDFLLIIPEKTELSEWNGEKQDQNLVAEDEHDYFQNPKPGGGRC